MKTTYIKYFYLIIFTTLISILASCKEPDILDDGDLNVDTGKIKIETIFQGFAFGNDLSQNTFIITTQNQFDDLLLSEYGYLINNSSLNNERNTINFEKEILLGIVSISHKDAKCNLQITNAELKNENSNYNSTIEISSELNLNESELPFSNSLAFHFVKIPNSNSEIKFLPTKTIDNREWLNLDSTSWVLSAIEFSNGQVQISNDFIHLDQFNLNFLNNKINGRSACNTYGGNYNAENSQIQFSNLYASDASCELTKEFEDFLYIADKYYANSLSLSLYASTLNPQGATSIKSLKFRRTHIKNTPIPIKLENTKWILVGAKGIQGEYTESLTDLFSGDTINLRYRDNYISFTQDKYELKIECNKNNNTYKILNNQLILNSISQHREECSLINLFMYLITKPLDFSVEKNKLELKLGNTYPFLQSIIFEKYVDNKEKNPLINSKWTLQSYKDEKGINHNTYYDRSSNRNISLDNFTLNLFKKELDGKAFCNSFFGKYEAQEKELEIEIEDFTEAHCPFSLDYINALNYVQEYSIIQNSTLKLTIDNGFLQELTFKKQ